MNYGTHFLTMHINNIHLINRFSTANAVSCQASLQLNPFSCAHYIVVIVITRALRFSID
jgi:hypothetical protein